MLLAFENAAERDAECLQFLEAQGSEYVQRNGVKDFERQIVEPLPFARHLEKVHAPVLVIGRAHDQLVPLYRVHDPDHDVVIEAECIGDLALADRHVVDRKEHPDVARVADVVDSVAETLIYSVRLHAHGSPKRHGR